MRLLFAGAGAEVVACICGVMLDVRFLMLKRLNSNPAVAVVRPWINLSNSIVLAAFQDEDYGYDAHLRSRQETYQIPPVTVRVPSSKNVFCINDFINSIRTIINLQRNNMKLIANDRNSML